MDAGDTVTRSKIGRRVYLTRDAEHN
jgi:hypothetical protein